MTIDATGNAALDQLNSSYIAREVEEEEDYLGREEFLTMLVAQLQNQDPLNPMEGSDFSAQLAQFSSLEQLINLNESMDSMVSALENSTETNGTEYIGKEVTGNADSIEMINGQTSAGYYTLDGVADVMVTIYNDQGQPVRSLFPGQKEAGTHSVSWDGTDNNGNSVGDGTYTYSVMADAGYGYAMISTAVTGTVEGVFYSNGNPYLLVEGVMISPDSLIQVGDPSVFQETSSSIVDYLGSEITTSNPMAYVESGYISGNTISFDLGVQEDVAVAVHDALGNVVNSFTLPADETTTGTNTVYWDGTTDSGSAAPDGLYSFSVTTASGSLDRSTTDDVSGIKVYGGNQYLVLGDSGALANVSSITEIN